MRFFFYGTLMDAAVRRAVLGAAAGQLLIAPALLRDWRRCTLPGRTYPAVVPSVGSSVPGLLAANIDRPSLRRLDRFETGEYRRVRLEVSRADGTTVAAWVYVAGRAAAAAGRPWDFDRWRARHRDALLRRLGAGRQGADSADS